MSLEINWLRHRQDTVDKLLAGVQYVYLDNVEGEIAEFGTASGETAKVLATALQLCEANFSPLNRILSRPRKMLHLFDSFEGLPKSDAAPDTEMPYVKAGLWGPGAFRGLTAQQTAELIQTVLKSDQFTIYEGWFSNTLKTVPDGTKFALLHIDCDLYSSTMDVLVSLFERKMISTGAMILFDDWNCNRASPNLGERKAWSECVQRYCIQFSDEGSYGIESHKFIVHNYTSEPA